MFLFLLGNKKCLEKTFMQMFHCKPIELIDQILMARVVCTETVGKKMRFKLWQRLVILSVCTMKYDSVNKNVLIWFRNA